MKYIALVLLLSVTFSQDVNRTSEFKTSTFMGVECDDTEYRNEWGRPNWKNYGQWLSECDSISTTYYDAEFAERKKKQQEEERLAREKELAEPLDDLDLDAMWDNTVWVEIQDVSEEVVYETEYITAVAGVRGAEAEDEALEHLYYRRSMKKLSKLDLQRALGKLILKKEKMLEKNLDTSKIDTYIRQVKNKLKRV
tara:strand:- start:77 stop:664 length:588 start_codon:yes stop_codon:yes gene_type:complete